MANGARSDWRFEIYLRVSNYRETSPDVIDIYAFIIREAAGNLRNDDSASASRNPGNWPEPLRNPREERQFHLRLEATTQAISGMRA
jgi:hypothetical protein